MKVYKKVMVLAIVGLFLGAFAVSTLAFSPIHNASVNNTIYVDDDAEQGWYDITHRRTIQDAVSIANQGDTIFVYNGTYPGDIYCSSVRLIGENINSTFIGYGPAESLIDIGSNVEISGFTISAGRTLPSKNEGGTYIGMYVLGSNNIISSNNISGNGICIYLKNPNGAGIINNNSIINNLISNRMLIDISSTGDSFGIILGCDTTDHNEISGNTIQFHERALHLFSSSENKIHDNNFLGNDFSIKIEGGSSDNWIYHNNFLGNKIKPRDESLNNWDDGGVNGGNYWDDYTGEDNNGDGIGDIPYFIEGVNKDNFPFMTKDGWKDHIYLSDLYCSDSHIVWSNVLPNDMQTATISIRNNGESDSKLNWKIISYPTWGKWTFTPKSGIGLTPSDESVAIEVFVVAPDVEESTFSGEIMVINEDDSSDYETISFSLSTPKNNILNYPFLYFLNTHPQLFQLLRNILGYTGEK